MTDLTWEERRTSFGSAAELYQAGRPGYPREMLLQCLPDEGNEILDLAAGTGPITATMLDLGFSVIAVEPIDEMRALVPAGARTLAGTAEAIPLPDESVDAVFIGQAWHWFDIPRAVDEIHRVLRPGGVMAPMWNLLDADDPVSRVLGEVAAPDECSDKMMGDDATPPYDVTDKFAPPQRLITQFALPYNRDRVAAMIASTSVAILAAPEDREQLLEATRSAMPEGDFFLSWVCEAWPAIKL